MSWVACKKIFKYDSSFYFVKYLIVGQSFFLFFGHMNVDLNKFYINPNLWKSLKLKSNQFESFFFGVSELIVYIP